MDTRFWGPSGWRLLHLIVSTPLNNRKIQDIREFFRLTPFILPCKFCRHSLATYYEKRPIPEDNLEHWLYNIHNDVNEKLHSQGLLKEPNPTYKEIHDRYKQWAETPCAPTKVLGWDFLFSVANTTPSRKSHSSPMKDAPPNTDTPELQNKWNTMGYKERLPYLQKWWGLIGRVLPFGPWMNAWSKSEKKMGPINLQKGKKPALAWLYSMEQSICRIMAEEAQHNSFNGLCKEITAFSSGCGKTTNKRIKTCRAKKQALRNTLRRDL
jgi:hypothetical protein